MTKAVRWVMTWVAATALALAAGCSHDESCGLTPPSCSVERESERACSADVLCPMAACGASGTCCWCEDGELKTIEVDCSPCDAGPPDAPGDAPPDGP